MDCIVHGVAKSQTRLSDFHFHFCVCVCVYISLICVCVYIYIHTYLFPLPIIFSSPSFSWKSFFMEGQSVCYILIVYSSPSFFAFFPIELAVN